LPFPFQDAPLRSQIALNPAELLDSLRFARMLLTLTQHGYGKSTMGVGAGDYSIKMFADDVIEVMDALRADVFSVVGMSTGGNYALAIAAQYVSEKPLL